MREREIEKIREREREHSVLQEKDRSRHLTIDDVRGHSLDIKRGQIANKRKNNTLDVSSCELRYFELNRMFSYKLYYF